jgi:hypothetical protein
MWVWKPRYLSQENTNLIPDLERELGLAEQFCIVTEVTKLHTFGSAFIEVMIADRIINPSSGTAIYDLPP